MTLAELTPDQWLQIGISAGIVLVTAVFGYRLISLVLGGLLHRLTRRTQTTLDDAILRSLRAPLYWLILVAALQAALGRLDFLTSELQPSLDNLYFSLYLFIGFVALWRLIVGLAGWYAGEVAPRTESTVDAQLTPFLRRLALIILTILAAIMFFSHFEVDVSGLVATLGIGSLALALAAQEALSDTISGFIIMIDRPFRIGDRVELLDLDTWGDVVDIGLRSTRIRTRDARMVIVPNSVISKNLIVNYSSPDSQYRIQIDLGLAYGTDIERARQVIVEAVSKVDGVLSDLPVEALFLQFGDSSLVFRVRWWLESYVDTRIMFDRVNSTIYHALNQASIEIPFPQREVHHKLDPADRKYWSEALRGVD